MPVLDNGEYRLPMLDKSKPHEKLEVWVGSYPSNRINVNVMTKDYMGSVTHLGTLAPITTFTPTNSGGYHVPQTNN